MSDAIEAHLIEKFEIVRRLGKGAYGIVWQAIKRSDEKVVALKKVFDAFHNKTDAQRYFILPRNCIYKLHSSKILVSLIYK